MVAAYICSVWLKEEEGETPKDAMDQAWEIVDEWEPAGGRGARENWWAGPSHFGEGYCAIYFAGDMSLEEIKAWKREFQKVMDLRPEATGA